MTKIVFTESYEKRAKKFLKTHPALKKQYTKTIHLLALNPKHSSLRLHKLHGRLADLYSVSINISYRITLQFIIKNNSFIPIYIGKHDEVY